MNIKVAIAHIADSRQDFFEKRKDMAEDEIKSLTWIRDEYSCIESNTIQNLEEVCSFAEQVRTFGAQSLIIHVPIWADPILAVKLHNNIDLPVLLLGNSRPETSSFVGILGAGGALDQVGCKHFRVLDNKNEQQRIKVIAFIKAAFTVQNLKGQTLGRFGGRSLGITTADADTAQWQRIFGIDIQYIDQSEIIENAENIDKAEVEKHMQWLLSNIGGVEFNEVFTVEVLEKQVRSYIATKNLTEKYKIDFVAVKCQPELSDCYVSQCLAHLLMNGSNDADGKKDTFVHACESDADAALTMQIMRLLSHNSSAALLDVRWYNQESGLWTFANCGAIPMDFFATESDPIGLSNVKMVQHTFGKGGGCALPGVVKEQKVTLARLCRKNGQYWMAIVPGNVEKVDEVEMNRTTNVFPKAFIRNSVGTDFLNEFGSNHIHMVSGDITEELTMFCEFLGMTYKIWR